MIYAEVAGETIVNGRASWYRQSWDADLDAFRDARCFAEPPAEAYAAWLEDPEITTPAGQRRSCQS
jgi:hypothetical protein